MSAARLEATESAKCYLLDLPGELRNKIYHYAAEDEPVTYHSLRLRKYSDEDLRQYGAQKTRPSFIGLTQACRQLRQEYSPIYAAQASIHVCHLDLEEYFNMKLPLLARGVDGKIIGKLYLDCRSTLINPRYFSGEEPEIEISPLLALSQNHPRLHVRGGVDGCGCRECKIDWADASFDLNHFFAEAQYSERAESLVSGIVSMKLCGSKQVKIKMRKASFDEWITKKSDKNFGEVIAFPNSGSDLTPMVHISVTNSEDEG